MLPAEPRVDLRTLNYQGIIIELHPYALKDEQTKHAKTLLKYVGQDNIKVTPTTPVLTKVYFDNFVTILQDNPEVTAIRTILLGSGGFKFPPRFCFYALLDALVQLGRQHAQTLPKVCLYFRENEIYSTIEREVKVLQNLLQNNQY